MWYPTGAHDTPPSAIYHAASALENNVGQGAMPLGEVRAASHGVVIVMVVHRRVVHQRRAVVVAVMVVVAVVVVMVAVTAHHVVPNYLALLVVDLVALLVAEQKDRATEQEYRGAPTNTVRPAKLPHQTVAWNQNYCLITRSRILFYCKL